MRTREEIEGDTTEVWVDYHNQESKRPARPHITTALQLEVLLDIRDLLASGAKKRKAAR